MADHKEKKVGLADVRDLMPKGREIYAQVRDRIMSSSHGSSDDGYSPAVKLLINIARDHHHMRPPLPEEVVSTINDFIPQYNLYVFGEDIEIGDDEHKRRLDTLADGLISVVFEYGYRNVLDAPPVQD